MFRNIFYRGAIYFLLFTATSIIVVTIFISSVGISTVSNSVNPYLSSYINLALPENFGFFTKSPREECIKFFREQDGLLEEINLRATTSSNFFGLSRNSRRMGYELGVVIRQIPDSSWKETDSKKFFEVDFSATTPFKIRRSDNLIRKIKSGNYILYYYEPVSWELHKYQTKTYGKYAYIMVE